MPHPLFTPRIYVCGQFVPVPLVHHRGCLVKHCPIKCRFQVPHHCQFGCFEPEYLDGSVIVVWWYVRNLFYQSKLVCTVLFKSPQSVWLNRWNSSGMTTTWSIVDTDPGFQWFCCSFYCSGAVVGPLLSSWIAALFGFLRRFRFRPWAAHLVPAPSLFWCSGYFDCSVSCTGTAFWYLSSAPSALSLTFVRSLMNLCPVPFH